MGARIGATNREAALHHLVAKLPGAMSGILSLPCDAGWQLLREYPATHEEGAPAKVWVHRMPAAFYRLTTGDIEITTGSGDNLGVLLCDMAEAIAGGMLGFELGGAR